MSILKMAQEKLLLIVEHREEKKTILKLSNRQKQWKEMRSQKNKNQKVQLERKFLVQCLHKSNFTRFWQEIFNKEKKYLIQL